MHTVAYYREEKRLSSPALDVSCVDLVQVFLQDS